MFPWPESLEGYGKHIKHMPECRVSGGRKGGGRQAVFLVQATSFFDIKLLKNLRQFYAISVESDPQSQENPIPF